MSPKRHRVALRPKARARKLRRVVLLAAAVGIVAAVIAGAGLAGREIWRTIPAVAVKMEAASVEGAPEPLNAELNAWLAAHPGAQAADLMKAFPVLAHVQEGRSGWRVVLRKPVARTADGALLAADGAVFKAGFLDAPAVEVEVAKAPEDERKALAAFLAETPVSVSRMKFVSDDDGWEALLSDGTRVLWGGLKFTREKAERLKQALEDARAKQPGEFLADLRYFEDGRILLRKP